MNISSLTGSGITKDKMTSILKLAQSVKSEHNTEGLEHLRIFGIDDDCKYYLYNTRFVKSNIAVFHFLYKKDNRFGLSEYHSDTGVLTKFTEPIYRKVSLVRGQIYICTKSDFEPDYIYVGKDMVDRSISTVNSFHIEHFTILKYRNGSGIECYMIIDNKTNSSTYCVDLLTFRGSFWSIIGSLAECGLCYDIYIGDLASWYDDIVSCDV